MTLVISQKRSPLVSKAKKPIKKKKIPKNYYFNQTTENAIIRYNNTDDVNLKNKIYNEHISYAFDKLAENIIHTFKFYYFDIPSEQVKHEVVSFLVMNMHKFQEGKGKAFSYFSIVAKNYLILHNNNNYKKMKSQDPIDVLEHKKPQKSVNPDPLFEEEFIEQMLEYWENNLTKEFQETGQLDTANTGSFL